MRLNALLGDYPVTRALRQGALKSEQVCLDFADVKTVHMAFKRVVRDLEFDVAELAIMTFLMARARGTPLVLLPAVITARFQHPYLVYNAERGHLAPQDLAGRRVGIRSYSVTTAAWIRDILARDYGVDPGRVRWVTFEDAHVAEFSDPHGVERAPAGKNPMDMLIAGELDAAVVGTPVSDDPRLKTLFPDPAAAAADWQRRNRAIQINHMVVVRQSLADSRPCAVQEVYRLLLESRGAAGRPAPGAIDLNPFGLDANRHNLELAIDCAYSQGLIARRFAVEELFHDATRIR
jgi:4,5-dihydroxyphthalate decarboxylase